MEGMKNIFKTLIEAKLASAPDSQAKTDLVEELADNLHCRYEDMVRGGISQEEALVQAMDALGDVDELLDYLNDSRTDAGEGQKKAGGFASDMDEMFRNIGTMVKGAVDQAKTAVSEVDWAGVANSAAEGTKNAGRNVTLTLKNLAKKAKENGGSWTGRSGDKTIHVTVTDDEGNTVDVEPGDEQPDAKVKITTDKDGSPKIKITTADEAEKKDDGWKLGVTVEKNPEDGSESAPGDRAFYGVGYDKDKGGFYGQWGKEKEAEKVPVDGPVESAALRGIDVQLVKGDVNVTMDLEPDADVLVGGEGLECLDVSVSEGGVLMIRPRREPAGFFGTTACDDGEVELDLQLPRREWQFLRLNTASGDIELNGDQAVDTIIVKTTSGDFAGEVASCGSLEFSTVSGDMDWKGNAENVQCSAVNGDLVADGTLGSVSASTVNGDVDMRGAVGALRCSTTNGDLSLVSSVLPKAIVTQTRAGDCSVIIPDGDFRVSYDVKNGEFTTNFFKNFDRTSGCLVHGQEGGAEYSFQSFTGDVQFFSC